MKYNINLLKEEKKQTLVDRVFYFVLNYLRYIIVVTQLVVICTFFAKFALDQQIVDLQEEIDQKQEIVKMFQPLIKDSRTVSVRLKEIEGITNQQPQQKEMMTYVLQRFPQDFTLKEMTVSQRGIILSGYTTSSNTLESFNTRLKSENRFKSINLKSMSRSANGLEFYIEMQQFKS